MIQQSHIFVIVLVHYDIKVYSENQNQIILTYILTAIDKIKGKTQTEKFNGTVVMINQNGSWKIDDMKNKQRK